MVRATSVTLTVTGGAVVGEARRGSTVRWAASVPFDGVEGIAPAVEQLAKDGGFRTGSAVLVVAACPVIQVRRLTGLPTLRQRSLKATVRLQAGRFFRRNGTPLVTDAVWVRGTPRFAFAAAVEEPWLEQVLAGVQAARLSLVAVRPQVDGGERLDLVPGARRNALEAHLWRRVRRLVLSSAILAVAGVATFAVRLESARAEVHAELTALEGPILAVREARRSYDRAQIAVEMVTSHKAARGKVLQRLADMTEELADSSYLTRVTVGQGNDGLASGISNDALSQAAAWERSGSLANVRLDGLPYREMDQGRRRERFTVVFGDSTWSR